MRTEGPGSLLIQRFRADERGAASIEYGMIVLIMAVGIIGTIRALPTSLNTIWDNLVTNLK